MWVIDHCIFSHWIIIIDSLLLSLLSNSVMNLIHCANTAFTRPQSASCLNSASLGHILARRNQGHRPETHKTPCKVQPLGRRLHQMWLHMTDTYRRLQKSLMYWFPYRLCEREDTALIPQDLQNSDYQPLKHCPKGSTVSQEFLLSKGH